MFERDELFRLLVSSVRDYAIFMLDPQGCVGTWNAGAERVKGYASSEIIGRHFSVFYLPEEVASGKCEMELAVATETGRFEDEGWRVRKDGSRFWASVVLTAVRDESTTLIGFAKVTRDLTERKREEEERSARRAAEQANIAKDEFLAMLGHELRNPLAPIVTALNLIKMRGDTTMIKEHQIIERQVTHMVRLVDDLLDVSRITRGKVELKRKAVDLRTVITKSIETATPMFELRVHHLAVTVPNETVTVDGDEGRLVQIVTNLLTNAAKYSDPGSHIDVTLAVAGAEACVRVSDDGRGISPALLPHVFESFVQGPQPPDRTIGGLGLGLTLVKSLVGMHGGRALAHSDGVGRGSTFTVWFPISRGVAKTTEAPPLSSAVVGAKHRVLIVDDNEDALMLLSELVAAAGYEVRSALDGPSALTEMATFSPDIAILDIGLPVMDGYELVGRLRDLLPSTPRFIALSGYGQQTDRERSKAAGFDVHLVKPVDIRRLLDTLA